MRILNSAAAVVTAVSTAAFLAAMQPVEADFIFYAEQSGTNVVINGTGSINTTGLGAFSVALSGTGGYSANIQQNQLLMGTTSGSQTMYINSTVNGPIYVAPLLDVSGTAPVLYSGGYFGFGSLDATQVYLPTVYVSNTPFSNSATWYGATLASWGWPPAGTWASPVTYGTWTLSTGETVSIVGVPEPAPMVFVAAMKAALGARRLRKLRRSRRTAGEAIAGQGLGSKPMAPYP